LTTYLLGTHSFLYLQQIRVMVAIRLSLRLPLPVLDSKEFAMALIFSNTRLLPVSRSPISVVAVNLAKMIAWPQSAGVSCLMETESLATA
jgi:hypothetical protein